MFEQGKQSGIIAEFTAQAPLYYTSAMIVTFFVLIFAVILAVAALFRVEQLDNVRCWSAVGEHFVDGHTNIQLSTGNGAGGTGFVDFAVEYTLPAGEGDLLQVLLEGPIVLGVDPADTPTALTICGGIVACVDLETETCLREGKPVGCGRLANKVRRLDVGDVPVESGGRIVHLASMLEQHPERFRITVTSFSSPDGIHRAYIGALCKL